MSGHWKDRLEEEGIRVRSYLFYGSIDISVDVDTF